MSKQKLLTQFDGEALVRAMDIVGWNTRELQSRIRTVGVDVSTQSIYNWYRGICPNERTMKELRSILPHLPIELIVAKKGVKRERSSKKEV